MQQGMKEGGGLSTDGRCVEVAQHKNTKQENTDTGRVWSQEWSANENDVLALIHDFP